MRQGAISRNAKDGAAHQDWLAACIVGCLGSTMGKAIRGVLSLGLIKARPFYFNHVPLEPSFEPKDVAHGPHPSTSLDPPAGDESSIHTFARVRSDV